MPSDKAKAIAALLIEWAKEQAEVDTPAALAALAAARRAADADLEAMTHDN
jgi:hypothetical protein